MNTRKLTQASIIAGLYIALTMICQALGLASQPIQIRISEALCVLPAFYASSIPGLFVGCLLSNVLCGGTVVDIIFGSLTTLIAALITYALSKYPYLASIPPIILNALVIPAVLMSYTDITGTYFYFFVCIFLGELISCGIFGTILVHSIKTKKILKHLK